MPRAVTSFMKVRKLFAFAFVGAILCALPCLAADIYVAQATQGADTGADAADAHSLAWLDTSANWGIGANQVAAGVTVHLCGTLTNTLTIGGSGTSGNPITIYFEPNAKFSAPTLAPAVNFINVDGRSWIVIDGGSNGLMTLTDNGTAGTYDYANNVVAIYGASAGVDHIVFQNLSIRNLYQRTTNTDTGAGTALYITGSDVTYSNLTLGEAYGGIAHSYTPTVSSNLTIVNCSFTNYNHAIEIGCGGATVPPVLLNLTISHNSLQSGDMFESPDGVDVGLHRDCIFLFNESGLGNGGVTIGCISNILISCNFIKHGWHPLSHTAGSGGMFFDTYNNAATLHVRVFNNISVLAYPLSWSGGGGYAGAAGVDVLFANNTIVGWQTNGGYGGGYAWTISGTNAQAFNNISLSSKANWMATEALTAGLTNNNATSAQLLAGVVSDYNIFNGITGYGGWVGLINTRNNGGVFSELIYDTLAQFQNMLGGLLAAQVEPHSTTATVQLDSNFAPLSTDTVATGHGTNLTAFAIADNLPGLTNDFAGNPRPATGNWTIGAYQGGTVQKSAAISVSSASQDFGMVAVGAMADQTITITNTGGGTLSGSEIEAAPFSIVSGGSYNLAAGQSQTITVSYSPTAAGTNSQVVTFNGGAGASSALTGTAVAKTLPPPQALQAHAPGQ